MGRSKRWRSVAYSKCLCKWGKLLHVRDGCNISSCHHKAGWSPQQCCLIGGCHSCGQVESIAVAVTTPADASPWEPHDLWQIPLTFYHLLPSETLTHIPSHKELPLRLQGRVRGTEAVGPNRDGSRCNLKVSETGAAHSRNFLVSPMRTGQRLRVACRCVRLCSSWIYTIVKVRNYCSWNRHGTSPDPRYC